jgi:hypothetical protein
MIHSSPAYSGEKKFYVQVKYTKATSPWPWHVQIMSIWLLLNWLWFLLHVLILWWVEPNWSPHPIQYTNIGSIINQITVHSRIIWNRKIQFLLWANQFSCLLRRSMARHLLKKDEKEGSICSLSCIMQFCLSVLVLSAKAWFHNLMLLCLLTGGHALMTQSTTRCSKVWIPL